MYRLIDTGNFQKLEQVGPYHLVRPAAQAVWRPRLGEESWQKIDAVFRRSAGGDGRWDVRSNRLPESWIIATGGAGDAGARRLVIRTTDFGHLGIFPEQHANWDRLSALVRERASRLSDQRSETPFQVLNLFAYTGGSTLACAAAGAHVVHLDASKTSVAWGRENAEASGLADRPVRWIVDDVQKFVSREVRRGSKYHGIILDPPSFGRGPKGETWKIEEMLPPLLDDLAKLLAPDFAFVLLSSHSEGYTPMALTNLLAALPECSAGAGTFSAEEMIVRETSESGEPGRPLPSGASCLYARASDPAGARPR
jgi:23S rRNA (cytosine1962-C5)-methyltransferase